MTYASPALTCYRHPGRETYVRCTRCERPICPDCMHEASVGFQCPQCVAEGRVTQRQPRTWFGGTAAGQLGYVTMTIIGLNVLVFIVDLIISRGQAMGNGLLGEATLLHHWGAIYGPDIAVAGPPCPDEPDAFCPVTQVAPGLDSGAYYRLITAMFLHYGPLHLLLNMWVLWVLGRQLEMVLGPLRFAALYLVSGLGGSIAAYLFDFGATPAMTAGASGAVYGLFGALLLVLRRLGRSAAPIMPILIINFLFTFAVSFISISGHVGGFLIGMAATAGLVYAPQKNRTAVQVAVLVGLTVVLLLLAVYTPILHSLF